MAFTYEQKRQFEEQKTWAAGIVSSAQKNQFYGKFTIIMEGGIIRRIIKEESIIPPSTK